jgi:putative FmdB family regulatory protein
MPNYDYLCPKCQKRVSVFQRYQDYGVKPVACPECGTKKLKRLINRVRIAKSEDRRLDDLSDPSFLGDVDENDPRSLGRAMRKMGEQMGEEMPAEFSEVTRRLESGESPEAIEKDMPELAGGDSGGGDFDE